MATEAVRTVTDLAEQRWGLVTTAQAAQVGVSRAQMSYMATSGTLVRVAQGVYRVAGAPEHEFEPILATWMALGGPTLPLVAPGVSAVVAAGATATILHRLGTFMPGGGDFIVPARRFTRLPGVRLRVRVLDRSDVTHAEGVPTLTVERTVADLVASTDLSLVADVVRDAVDQGRLVRPAKLIDHLDPLARGHGFGDGHALAEHLFDLAGTTPPSVIGSR